LGINIPEREYILVRWPESLYYYRAGIKKDIALALTPEELGRIVEKERKAMGLTQADLALTSGTGMRFISDLENGKPTCQIGKTLTVLKTLGIRLTLSGQHHAGRG
jgi:y4mF family transcriptional regulator